MAIVRRSKQPTPFMGSHERPRTAPLTGVLFIRQRHSALPKVAHWALSPVSSASVMQSCGLLTHLKFENRLRSFSPQGR
ncbi:hypothetical protein JTE90_011141 [Oedothorax gibbosus]|uniref:Uncharacterized protein n=1 Tax=Oedothorax gibbosus TaxID=931172 RepID=A0AAV6TJW4_9ARAC|nr:hypothetical protein JTE90_011141 [Oedothorax gibbosus]